MVAGQAKRVLVGNPALHAVYAGGPTGGPTDAVGGWVIRFESDAGGFDLRLCSQ